MHQWCGQRGTCIAITDLFAHDPRFAHSLAYLQNIVDRHAWLELRWWLLEFIFSAFATTVLSLLPLESSWVLSQPRTSDINKLVVAISSSFPCSHICHTTLQRANSRFKRRNGRFELNGYV